MQALSQAWGLEQRPKNKQTKKQTEVPPPIPCTNSRRRETITCVEGGEYHGKRGGNGERPHRGRLGRLDELDEKGFLCEAVLEPRLKESE